LLLLLRMSGAGEQQLLSIAASSSLLTPLIILFASVRSKILDSLFFLPPHREKMYLT